MVDSERGLFRFGKRGRCLSLCQDFSALFDCVGEICPHCLSGQEVMGTLSNGDKYKKQVVSREMKG